MDLSLFSHIFILLYTGSVTLASENLRQYKPEIVTLTDTKATKWADWITKGWRPQALEMGKLKAFMTCGRNVWLRTPLIQRYEAKEIFVHIEFNNMTPKNGNKTKILLIEADTDEELKEEISENDFINSSTVKGHANEEKFSYISENEKFTVYDQIIRFPLTQNRKGFSIAFESKSSCLMLIRMNVYYKTCSAIQDNFAEFPKTVTSSIDTKVEGVCLPGSGILPNRLPPIRICSRDGYWIKEERRGDSDNSECQCLPGFTATTNDKSTTCRICSQGEYKFKLGPSECLKCPQNSVSSKVPYDFVEEDVKQLQHMTQIPGFVSCSCLPRFYRNSEIDQFTDPCTSLPSQPTNLEADTSDVAKVRIKWTPPSNIGGRRNVLDYNIECRVVEKNQKRSCGKRIRIKYPSEDKNNNEVLVHGLIPGESYEFSVIALNELSSLPNIDLDYSTAVVKVIIPKPSPVEVFNLRYVKLKLDKDATNKSSPQGGSIFVTWDPPNEVLELPRIPVEEYEINILIENGTDISGRVMMSLYVYFMKKNEFYFSALPYNKTIIVKVRPRLKNGPWGTFETSPEIIFRSGDKLLTKEEIPSWVKDTYLQRNNLIHTDNVFQRNHKLLVVLFSIGFVVFFLFIVCAVFSLYRRFHRSEKCHMNGEVTNNPHSSIPPSSPMKDMSLMSSDKRNFYAASSMTNSSTNHSKSEKNSLQELILQNKSSNEEKRYLMELKKASVPNQNQYLNPTAASVMGTPQQMTLGSTKKTNKNPRNNSDSGNSSREIDCHIENLDDEMPIYNESMMYEEAQISYGKEIDPSCIYNSVVIGSGEFGEVCRAYMKTNTIEKPKFVAIKTLKATASQKEREDFLAEALIISQLRHPHIVCLEGVVTMTDPIMIIFEYMENHSLDKYLRANRGNIYVVKLMKILSGIASAMSYIVDSGYIHRDLAARNILVNDQMVCKVSDFGLSRKIDFEDSDDASYTTMGGKIPVRWTAPEAITLRKFSASSDVWSFGILSWEVMSMGERPYWNWSNQAVLEAVESGYRLPIPKGCPLHIHKLMLKCWQANRLDRPTFCDIEMQLEALIQSGIEAYQGFPMMYANGTLNHYPTLDNHELMCSNFQFDAWILQAGLQSLSSRLKACGISSMQTLKATNFDEVQRLGLFTNRELQMLIFHASQNPANPILPN